jgi:putative sigma-54 modulation protein
MNIKYKGTHTSLSEADMEYIENKLKTLGNFIKNQDSVFVEAARDSRHSSGLVFRLEVSINPPQHYAEARGNDFYEALDLVIPKIKEQMVKQKDKKISMRRRKTSLKRLK